MSLPESLKGQDLCREVDRKAERVLEDAMDGVYLFTKDCGKLLLSLTPPDNPFGEDQGQHLQLFLEDQLERVGTVAIRRLAGTALLRMLTFELSPALQERIGCGAVYRLTAIGKNG